MQNEVLQQFMAQFATMVIDATVPIIVTMLIGVVWRFGSYVKAKLSVEQVAFIDAGVKMAVQAAEQVGLKDEFSKDGQQKLALATSILQDYLRAHGYSKLAENVPLLNSHIESAVNQGVHKWGNPVIIPSETTNVINNPPTTSIPLHE